MGEVPTIRPMDEADQAEVVRILCASYRYLAEQEGLPEHALEFLLSKRGSPETVRRESAEQAYMVASLAGVIVGMVAVGGDTITKLYVDPPYHGHGIGRALFGAAEASIKARGGDHLTLGSFPSAVAFYQAMGASIVGRKRPVQGPLAGHETVVMRKTLASP
jgi:ribosomal protein S18 acetylase RimI-like enzyme